MNHELASELLLELAYGDLPPREARDVEAHAAGCDACRAELARIRETRALMARLPVEPPPERGEAILLAAAREAAAARVRKRSLLPPWLLAGSVGAVAVAAVAVVSWQLGKTAPPAALHPRETDLMGASRAPPPAAPAPAFAQPPPVAAVEPAKGEGAGPPARREAARAVSVAPAPKAAWAPPPAPAPREPPPPTRHLAAEAPPAAAPEPAPPALAGAERAEAKAARTDRTEAMAEGAPSASRAPVAERRRAAARPSAAREPAREAGAVGTRSFAGCPGERRRIVELDGDGRVIRYVREGERRTIEHRYSPDGRLSAAAELVDGGRRPLPLDAPGLVRDARDAGIDAPPRCE